MPFTIDRDALKAEIDYIVDVIESQPVPEDLVAFAIAEGADMVDVLYLAHLAAGLMTGITARIFERMEHFIHPV